MRRSNKINMNKDNSMKICNRQLNKKMKILNKIIKIKKTNNMSNISKNRKWNNFQNNKKQMSKKYKMK